MASEGMDAPADNKVKPYKPIFNFAASFSQELLLHDL